MPKGIRNWSYKDVKKFLEQNDFSFARQGKGSHETWVKRGEPKDFVVTLSKKKIIPTGTMENIIRQSGIPKKDWKLK